MKETSHVTRLRGEGQLGQVARVRALEHGHALVGPQPFVQLSAADVEGDHARRASLQQDIREAAGRCPDVERVPAGGIDTELVEGVRELVAAARHVARRLLDDELRRLVHLLPGLLVAVHEPRHHERLRLRAARGEAALDQQHVQPLAHGGRLACSGARF